MSVIQGNGERASPGARSWAAKKRREKYGRVVTRGPCGVCGEVCQGKQCRDCRYVIRKLRSGKGRETNWAFRGPGR